MAFQVSPGVQVKEIDLTSLFRLFLRRERDLQVIHGPVGSRVLITSVNQLRNVFGDPTDDNAVDWLSAANFLAYTNNLQVVRVIGSGSANASVAGGVGTIKTLQITTLIWSNWWRNTRHNLWCFCCKPRW